ncbi:S-adenosyl-L-methionine-dependent methyltransferase [Hypomontagnella submonticulosa]|nr:S-adenosyl-L-methionine-dependent methyltransferase [Hypomontagnella submonticulosa]
MSTAPDPAFSSIRYLPTNEAYDRWATVYDTDGNFLQALDTIELKTLFPQFLRSITSAKPWRIVDLGCGTGRNTALLLAASDIEEVIALDSSKGMLEVARSRLQQRDEASSSKLDPARPAPKVHLEVFDLLLSSAIPSIAQQVDGVISTLVVEHVPLPVFFSQVSQMLKPGGVLLLTNMHAHMGGISQAGFVDTETGEKIRPTSYAHTVADVLVEASRWGLDAEGVGEGVEAGIQEKAVDENMVKRLGPRSKKWVGVTCWFGGLFRKRAS